MDAFFASVEQRDHPEWRGRPVVVGAAPDRRGVVSTCSYEARAFGVRSAMPSREAYRLCPHGIFVPPDFRRYKEASDRVFEIFNRFTPFVEGVSIDEAFLDVTGSCALFGGGREIARRIRASVAGEVRLTASVGIAPNKFLAKLGSEAAKPDGLFVVPCDEAGILAFLDTLKIGDLWGVGKATGETLRRAGFTRVADLRRAGEERLKRLLGESAGSQLYALAYGRDEREVVTESVEKSISREVTFDRDCRDRETVRETLRGLCGDVGRRVRTGGFYAAVGKLKLRWSDFTTITRQKAFPSAVCDDFAFRELAFSLFDREPFVKPVRLIGFGVTQLSKQRMEQLSLFGEEDANREKRERLSQALDVIHERLDALSRLRTVPSNAYRRKRRQ